MLTPGRTWAIAPAEHGPKVNETFDRYWQYDQHHGMIAVGWNLGRAPKDRDDLQALWDAHPCEEWTLRHHRMLERFWFDVQVDDWVVARAGRSRLVGIGTVEGEASYDPSMDGLTWGCNLRRVHWEHTVSRADAVPLRAWFFPQSTVYRLSTDSVADINRRLRQAGWDTSRG